MFGAVIAYLLQMLSFMRLRVRYPNLPRPYRSPLGMAGAIVAAAIALVTFCVLFLNPDYRPGVLGAGIWFVAGIVYFAAFGRGGLVLAPEEEFAQRMAMEPQR